MRKIFRTIAIVLINAFLLIDIAWAKGADLALQNQTTCLSPRLLVHNELFQGFYKNLANDYSFIPVLTSLNKIASPEVEKELNVFKKVLSMDIAVVDELDNKLANEHIRLDDWAFRIDRDEALVYIKEALSALDIKDIDELRKVLKSIGELIREIRGNKIDDRYYLENLPQMAEVLMDAELLGQVLELERILYDILPKENVEYTYDYTCTDYGSPGTGSIDVPAIVKTVFYYCCDNVPRSKLKKAIQLLAAKGRSLRQVIHSKDEFIAYLSATMSEASDEDMLRLDAPAIQSILKRMLEPHNFSRQSSYELGSGKAHHMESFHARKVNDSLFLAFLPELSRICTTEERLEWALNIEKEFMGVMLEEKVLSFHATEEPWYYCPEDNPRIDYISVDTSVIVHSFLKELFMNISDEQKCRDFIDMLEPRCAELEWGYRKYAKSLNRGYFAEKISAWIRNNRVFDFDEFNAFVKKAYYDSKDIKEKKCLVLDCDGVLWQGIIGEDGLKGINISGKHKQFQKKVKELGEKGIILAINSKNNIEDVETVLARHPDMILRKNDFAVIMANWRDKAANMRQIAKELNIGTDSFVFVDDSPQEQKLIQMLLPEVATFDFAAKGQENKRLIETLQNIFAKAFVTKEDKLRLESYQAKGKRELLKQQSATLDDYFRSLEMKVKIREGEENREYTPRILQLSQRTNQFNLTTERYKEKDILRFLGSKYHRVFTLELTDKFAKEGIVGLLIIREDKKNKFFIESFCLSCRAVGRGVEYAFMADVIGRLGKEGARFLGGEYRSTERNALVRDLYRKLGFSRVKEKNRVTGGKLNYYMFDFNLSKVPLPKWVEISGEPEHLKMHATAYKETTQVYGMDLENIFVTEYYCDEDNSFLKDPDLEVINIQILGATGSYDGDGEPVHSYRVTYIRRDNKLEELCSDKNRLNELKFIEQAI